MANRKRKAPAAEPEREEPQEPTDAPEFEAIGPDSKVGPEEELHIPGRLRTPSEAEQKRILEQTPNVNEQIKAMAQVAERLHNCKAARGVVGFLKKMTRIFSCGMSGIQALVIALLYAKTTAGLASDTAEGARALKTLSGCAELLAEAGLFTKSGDRSYASALDNAALIRRLYALIVAGLVKGVLDPEWLDADCAFGLLALARAWLKDFNRQTSAEHALGLHPGRGPGGERDRSVKARRALVSVLGDAKVCRAVARWRPTRYGWDVMGPREVRAAARRVLDGGRMRSGEEDLCPARPPLTPASQQPPRRSRRTEGGEGERTPPPQLPPGDPPACCSRARCSRLPKSPKIVHRTTGSNSGTSSLASTSASRSTT